MLVNDWGTMTRRFTDSEIALARRICNKELGEKLRLAEERKNESVADTLRRWQQEPLQPSYGPTPPWWDQAVAQEYGMVWVGGYGWMDETLWKDILAWQEGNK